MSYDRHVGVFSPEGRIYQTEYALKSVSLAPTAMAYAAADKLVLAIETDSKPLSAPQSKFYQISHEISAVATGYSSDVQLVLTYLRSISLNHEFNFGSPITLQQLAAQISVYMSNFGRYTRDARKTAMGRPFGCAVLICGFGRVFCVDAAGNAYEWRAKVIGSGAGSGYEEVERLYATKAAVDVVKDVMTSVVEEGFEVAVATPGRIEVVYTKK